MEEPAERMSAPPSLGERFVVSTLLGAGSFGRVYRARDTRYGMDVALKVLVKFHSEALRLFKNEFRALAHVSHANLVTLYELHAHADHWFYTMEHVPGVTLAEWAHGAPRSAEALRGTLLQLAAGTAALHEAGLLHRDLKPSNVLVAETGRVAVSDFGMIGALDPARGATDDRTIGTVAYSAPEIWMQLPVGPAADWYSFGVTMFELLTGKLPFAARGPDAIAARTRADGPAPSSVVAGVPEDLDALCARLLQRDPTRRPSGQECLAKLAGGAAPRVAWATSALPFVGRDAELDALGRALSESRTRGTKVHLLSAPSGMGKSALVEQLARQAAGLGGVVLRGRCHPHDALASRGLDGVVDGLGRFIARSTAVARAELVREPAPELRRMFPTLRDVIPQSGPEGLTLGSSKEERQVALASLARIFARLAEARPLVLIIDDLHWADEETGSALVSLAESLEDAPGLLILGTFRADHEATSPCVRALRDALPDATVHELAPLSAETSQALIRAVLGEAYASAKVDEVLSAAQGNPYLLQELASALRSSESQPGPETREALLDRVVLARVERLSLTAQRLLEVLTLAEGPLDASVVIDAADLAERDYLGDLAALRANRLVSPRLVDGRQSLEPYHARVREAVDRTIDDARRPRLHGALAEALDRAGDVAPRETIAQHYFEAGAMPTAFTHARAAAAEARAELAFGRCAAMLELAASTGVASAAERVELEAQRADALANAGRGPEAAKVFLALVTLDPARAEVHERRAAEQLLFSGHLTEGVAVLRRVLRRVGLELPTSRVLSVARVIWAQAFGSGRAVLRGDVPTGTPDPSLFARIDAAHAATLGLTMTDPLASAVMQAQHLSDAMRAKEPERLARAVAITMVHTAGGWYDPERTRRIRAVLDRLVTGERSPATVADVRLACAGAAWMEGRFADCLRDADEALDLLRRGSCVGMQWHLNTHHVMELEVLEMLGRWDDLDERLAPYIQDARERGDRFLEASLRARFRPTLMLAAGDPARARQEIEAARSTWAQSEFDLVALYSAIRASWCQLYVGNFEAAHQTMEETWQLMQRSLFVRVVFYRDMAAAARGVCLVALARSSAGRPELRAHAAKEGRAIADGLGATSAPLPVAYSRTLRAGLDALRDRPLAVAGYEAAARDWDALGAEIMAAACRHRAARLTPGTERPPPPMRASLERPARIFEMLVP